MLSGVAVGAGLRPPPPPDLLNRKSTLDTIREHTGRALRLGRRAGRRVGPVGRAVLLRLPRLALDPAGADDRAPPGGAALDAPRRALGRILRARPGQAEPRAGR